VRKTTLTLTIILALLLSAVVGALFVNLGKANPVSPDYDPINITLKFPFNTTYTTNSLNLTFIVDHRFQVEAWYSIDGKANEAVYPTSEQPFTLSVIGARMFSANLSDLSDGSHYLYVSVMNDREIPDLADAIVYFSIDTTPPDVSILSIKNKTFYTSDVALNFAVNEPVSQVTYSIDGQASVTVAENIILTNLPYGEHNVTVYAWDTAGNVGTSETMYFNVEGPEPFPTLPVAAASIIAIVVVGAGLLVYFKKRQKESGDKT
jgi:hypothetical protein